MQQKYHNQLKLPLTSYYGIVYRPTDCGVLEQGPVFYRLGTEP